MNVKKRNGSLEPVNLNKITIRIKTLIEQAPILSIDPIVVATKVIQGLYDGVSTKELDQLASEICATMSTIHPDYGTLAARLEISNLHKETYGSFSEGVKILHSIGAISDSFATYCQANSTILDGIVDYSRDFSFDYFGIKTLRKSYLLKDKSGKIIERPQDMWMRVAVFIHQGDLDAIKETYDLLSTKYFTHATPTLFNAGTVKPQLSSCFLLDMADDSIDGIYKTLSDCAKISQSAGGIGLTVSKIRASGSPIKGTNGISNGLTPMLRVFDATARYVDQGGGKRKGSIAIYLEPWHADVFEFLDLKKNHGKEEIRARDLFYALWIPDLFMQRVEKNEEWSLFDPAVAYTIIDNKKVYLYDVHSDEFDLLYKQLELEGKATRRVQARELWEKIVNNQIETGVPYLLYKDACNKKSNQQNLGTIKSSNLCTEIIQYTSPQETAVCNLASISLPAFVEKSTNEFSFEKLYNVTRVITRNLNKIIDLNYYPVEEAKRSNFNHRPIGIGVQGLADVYATLRYAFDSFEAEALNKKIFECIYKGAVDESILLSRHSEPYSSYENSPASRGHLQFDLWGIDRNSLHFDWKGTFDNLAKYGLRNSLLVAPMPTASTSQILGNNEATEPFTSNLYSRRTLAGEFIVVNKHLVNELLELGLWNDQIRQRIMAANGSVQDIAELPSAVRHRYRTAYEMSAKAIINQAADRAPFVCQSQSMNLFVSGATVSKLTSMHFYAWKKGLKTGCYYLRSEPARDAIKFTITDERSKEKGTTYSTITTSPESFGASENREIIYDQSSQKGLKNTIDRVFQEVFQEGEIGQVCNIDDPNCESCGS